MSLSVLLWLLSIFNASEFLVDETDERSGYEITSHADGLRLCQGFVTLYNQPRSQGSLLPIPAQRENSGNELDWRYKALRTSTLEAVRSFSIIDLPNHHQTKVNTNP